MIVLLVGWGWDVDGDSVVSFSGLGGEQKHKNRSEDNSPPSP